MNDLIDIVYRLLKVTITLHERIKKLENNSDNNDKQTFICTKCGSLKCTYVVNCSNIIPVYCPLFRKINPWFDKEKNNA